ncbi:Right handed beta helix region [Parapedobacter composti]|uniref:Right handed beta helix region n=1 Tax=Parapedobacter composti TaxID=623281 RepID=A0A1I1KDS5_9SPHI|nr:right-handed parallel beta-helix repeat-containing protein [Parapedobacter composti]SFC58937.1 Right handed beta helix region [Parapedobacter composti]
MFDIPGAAILMNGNDHVLEYNYIHDVAKEVNDLGAIYYGRDPSERGIVVRYNVIADIPHRFLTAGIYHDDGACGLTAYSNILVNAGQRAVLMGGGSDNKYYNNLFIGSEAGIFIDDRLRA